jgi:murein DD-endopeptidase MepM/ murein hydrolase activator NlpD
MEMEADPMKVVLLALIFCSFSKAAIQSRTADELIRYRSEVMVLGARLSSLEKEIGTKNNLYISSVEQIKQFEADVKLYREKLAEIHTQVRQAQSDNKRIVQSFLVEAENLDTEEWQKKAHLELLKQAQTRLKSKEEELISFENKVTEFDLKLSTLRSNEEELASVIKELENRKKSAMDLYLTKVQSKKLAETKVQKLKLKTKIAKVREQFNPSPIVLKKPDRFFKNPVDDFLTFSASPKGVTFKYQSIQPVKAVGDGKVVYAGDLANYGQVLLIDHGDDLRTVLLGKMDIRVKKNDAVKDGQILAYTQNTSKEDQNLYFEVRKKNTAQNTILWLDQNGVSKI